MRTKSSAAADIAPLRAVSNSGLRRIYEWDSANELFEEEADEIMEIIEK